MPSDPRLWMTFPIDFWMHPKIRPLSDSAFRAFVEINGYSRMNDLDGRVPVAAARATWKPKALAELLANHPERPSLSIDGDVYVIWNYSEHQETKASRARRQETNRANGAKGGRPAKANRAETQSVTTSEPTGKQSQSQSSDLTDVTYLPGVTPDPAARESGISPELALLVEEREFVRVEADKLGLRDVPRARRMLEAVVGPLPADDTYVIELVRAIVVLALAPVTNADAYVRTTCDNSPAEVQAQWATVQSNSPIGAVA